MSKLVDPIQVIAQLKQQTHTMQALAAETGLAYETPLAPPLGAKLMRLTIASTYRMPIPIMFDPATRTSYPITTES